MKILIVSGFLGAGKTTFIKELIQKSQKPLVVLENEYGQNSLDSTDIKANSDDNLKMIDFNEGCVCCTQKDVFSNTILAISAGVDPDYLVVEPTGVGKLSNIMLAIQKVSYEKIQLLSPIVVVCPDTFDTNMELYSDICKDQIQNASKIIFSKVENASPAVIEQTIAKIREFNKDAEIVSEHYSRKDEEWFKDLLLLPNEEREVIVENDEHFQMDQVSLRNVKLSNIGELVVLLEDCIHYEFGLIPRAKGIINIENHLIRFDLADQRYSIIEVEGDYTCECVFIGKYLDHRTIYKRLNIAMKNNTNVKFSKLSPEAQKLFRKK